MDGRKCCCGSLLNGRLSWNLVHWPAKSISPSVKFLGGRFCHKTLLREQSMTVLLGQGGIVPLRSDGEGVFLTSCEASHIPYLWLNVLMFPCHLTPMLAVLHHKISCSMVSTDKILKRWEFWMKTKPSSASVNSLLQKLLFPPRENLMHPPMLSCRIVAHLYLWMCLSSCHINQMYKTWVLLLRMGDCWYRLPYNTALVVILFTFII